MLGGPQHRVVLHSLPCPLVQHLLQRGQRGCLVVRPGRVLGSAASADNCCCQRAMQRAEHVATELLLRRRQLVLVLFHHPLGAGFVLGPLLRQLIEQVGPSRAWSASSG